MGSHLNPVNSLKTRRIIREPQGCFLSAQHLALIVINAVFTEPDIHIVSLSESHEAQY